MGGFPQNHETALALHFTLCNFAGFTARAPAMLAGGTDHVWETGEIMDLLGQ